MEIWKGLRGHTSWYGRRWLEIGYPDGALPEEHWAFTEKLVPFRDAARKATEDQRHRFLELSRVGVRSNSVLTPEAVSAVCHGPSVVLPGPGVEIHTTTETCGYRQSPRYILI
jgi:hypothetical protein